MPYTLNEKLTGIKRRVFYTKDSIWYERRLDGRIESRGLPPGMSLEFRIDDKEEIIGWLKEKHSLYPWIYFEREAGLALQNRHIYPVLFHNKHIIGYLKVGVGGTYIHDFGRIVRFPAGHAFIYDTFILPEYRGAGLASSVISMTMQFLKAMDYKKALCHIERWNTPSIKTYEKAGFRRIGRIRYCRLLYVPFFIRNGHRPLFNLDSFISG